MDTQIIDVRAMQKQEAAKKFTVDEMELLKADVSKNDFALWRRKRRLMMELEEETLFLRARALYRRSKDEDNPLKIDL
jgi:hypothetical protein